MSNLLARLRAGRLAGSVGLAWTMLVVAAGNALAEEAEHGAEAAHGAAEGGHGGGGLPQLDPTVFAPQLIWLAITFATLYYLMSKVALPRVAEVLEERQERITDDLDKAAALREESSTVMSNYEKALSDARAHAQTVIAQTAQEITTAQTARQSDFAADLAGKIRAAEDRVAAAKHAALANIRSVAVEATQQVAEKLAGIRIDAKEADSAVGAVIQERG
jgi:F-type H+-transporting ATPase subunit b